MRRHIPLVLLILAVPFLLWSVLARQSDWDWRRLPQPLSISHTWIAKLSSIVLGGSQCGLLPADHFVLLSQKVVLGDQLLPAAVEVHNRRIVKVTTLQDQLLRNEHAQAARAAIGLDKNVNLLNYGNSIISPGLIDTHVHMDEPGREHWEGFATATRAAAAGGLTTLIDMPLNNIPSTTTGDLVRSKMVASQGKLWVDVGIWGGITPANAHNDTVLMGMVEAGALGCKSFMSPSGSDFPNVGLNDIAAALPSLQKAGLPYYVHAELPIELPMQAGADPRSHATWLAQRPDSFELTAQAALLEALDRLDVQHHASGFRLHVAHVSSGQTLAAIAAAKRKGLPVSAETCPHYLNFAAEDIPDGATAFKCAPPIRSKANQDALWDALLNGTLDSLATDHSPAPPDMKALDTGDFITAWGGIAGLQYALPSTWTAMSAKKLKPELLSKWWSKFPAELAGLGATKGAIAEGMDADMVVWDPEALADTSAESLLHKHKVTPYADMPLLGRVHATFVGGRLVFSHGKGPSPAPCGQLIVSKHAKNYF